MRTPRAFRSKLFLYRLLAVIFAFEAMILLISFDGCTKLALSNLEKQMGAVSVATVCPELGKRAEGLFGVAIATVLSLLVGSEKEN